MSADRIADAIRDVLHAAPADRISDWPDGACERCGVDDGEHLAVMTHPGNRGTIRAHADCGEAAGYVPAPACDGAPDLCGAPAGAPCAPGCPSLAADPEPSDIPDGAR